MFVCKFSNALAFCIWWCTRSLSLSLSRLLICTNNMKFFIKLYGIKLFSNYASLRIKMTRHNFARSLAHAIQKLRIFTHSSSNDPPMCVLFGSVCARAFSLTSATCSYANTHKLAVACYRIAMYANWWWTRWDEKKNESQNDSAKRISLWVRKHMWTTLIATNIFMVLLVQIGTFSLAIACMRWATMKNRYFFFGIIKKSCW